jgi:hypothetical protein
MVALWLTTLALMYFLKQEMLAILAAQQYSVVSLLANDIDRSVTERLRALEVLAASIDAKCWRKPPVLMHPSAADGVADAFQLGRAGHRPEGDGTAQPAGGAWPAGGQLRGCPAVNGPWKPGVPRSGRPCWARPPISRWCR